MSGRLLPGRIPLWVDERPGPGPAVLLVHDVGGAPVETACLPSGWHGVVPHLRGHGRSGRVRGGMYVLNDLAADVVRAVALAPAPPIVVGVGRGALVAAVAAASVAENVRALGLVPRGSAPDVGEDPAPSRRRWLEGLWNPPTTPSHVDPLAALPFAEPLYCDDRDLLWRSVPRPVAWAGDAVGAWAEGAPADLRVHADVDVIVAVRRVVEALVGAQASQSGSSGINPASSTLPPST